jgi:hypothetical protein
VQLHRAVPQIGDPDPGHHSLYLCSSLYFGITITGSHLVIDGFSQIHHFAGCFLMNTPHQTDVILRNSGGRPIYFGARCGTIDDLTLESCSFYAHMPCDRWWLAYSDIKGGDAPADHVRKLGLDLGLATHVTVTKCVFEDFFDGILAKAEYDAPHKNLKAVAHHIDIQNSVFQHIWDDTWQMIAPLHQINFHHNRCLGAGPSVDVSGTKVANPDPGTVYIHHNVIDTTQQLVFLGRAGFKKAGMREAIPFSSHAGNNPAEILYTWPRKLYYNTVVTGLNPGGPDVGWSFFCAKARNKLAKHEVYNNIFVVKDGRPGGREFDATSQQEIYDGNVYWYETGSPWRVLDTLDENGNPKVINLADKTVTVEKLRELLSSIHWQDYYPPGWECSGMTQDPELDSDYKPHHPACKTGAVDLRMTHWPGTENIDEPWRGAVQP